MARKRNIFPEFSMRLPRQIPVLRPQKESNFERRIVREFWK